MHVNRDFAVRTRWDFMRDFLGGTVGEGKEREIIVIYGEDRGQGSVGGA
jgi:hypothetical protein